MVIIYNVSQYHKFLKRMKLITNEEYEDESITHNLKLFIRDTLLQYGQQCFFVSFQLFFSNWIKLVKNKKIDYDVLDKRLNFFKTLLLANCEHFKNKTFPKNNITWESAINEYNCAIENLSNKDIRWW